MSEEQPRKLKVIEGSTESAPDPFDPTAFRIAPDTTVAVKTLPLILRTKRKPGRQDFVRVRPEPEYRATVAVFEKDQSPEDTYLVKPEIYPFIKEECRRVDVFAAITRKGDMFLWLIPTADEEGKDNDWNRTNREAAVRAMGEWVSVRSNRSLGAYVVGIVQIPIPEPDWDDRAMRDYFAVAFKDRVVDSLEHPIVKQIQGLA